MNLPYALLREEDLPCFKNNICKSPVDSCRSAGARIWCEVWQFQVFLVAFFRNGGETLSRMEGSAPASIRGDVVPSEFCVGLFVKPRGAAKNWFSSRGHAEPEEGLVLLVDWV